MRRTVFASTVGVSLGAFALVAVAQNPPILPPTGIERGWTKEDTRTISKRPYDIGYMSATIVKLSVRKKTGRFIVTLDNGQRWSQTENKPDVLVSIGDEVKIQKTTLGSYTLVTMKGIETRVQRDR
jgi:hypothetical protein